MYSVSSAQILAPKKNSNKYLLLTLSSYLLGLVMAMKMVIVTKMKVMEIQTSTRCEPSCECLWTLSEFLMTTKQLLRKENFLMVCRLLYT